MRGTGSASGTSVNSGCGPTPTITVNRANMYEYEASLPDIFGPNVKPGRELLDAITST